MRRPIWILCLAAALGGCASTTALLVPAPAGPAPRSSVAEEEPASKAPPAATAKELPPSTPKPASPPPQPAPSAPSPPAVAAPAPRTAAIPREPSPPAPVLAPQASAEEEQRMKLQAERRIEGTEKLVQRIDPTRLAREERENYLTIQSFLSKAREALSSRDVQRAFTLADKAFLLASELSKTPPR